jgi:two-component system nitrate/nitrite sensor histidine kinase NarX
MAACSGHEQGGCTRCVTELAGEDLVQYRSEGGMEMLLVPLRDNDGLYGVMRLALSPGRRLEPWQEQLLEALSRHIGIALGISRKAEQERLLALQEERSVIARELHDSIAQSLSYMKIQASLLQPVLSDPAHRIQAEATLRDLRKGITSAYRQLRELLTTFRLKMQGDFLDLLNRTMNELAERGGLPIHLETRLEGCHLTPNQEIHSLHIIREALYNVLRHAQADQVWVRVFHDGKEARISVEDDGVGLPSAPADHLPHYGLNIMRERAASLQGRIILEDRPGGGTRVEVCFPAPIMHTSSQSIQPDLLRDPRRNASVAA